MDAMISLFFLPSVGQTVTDWNLRRAEGDNNESNFLWLARTSEKLVKNIVIVVTVYF